MTISNFHKAIKFAFAAVVVLAFSPTLIFAQGEVFTDCDAWSEAVCGNILDDDYDSFVDENGDLISDNFNSGIPTPQTVTWGQVSQDGNDPPAVSYVNVATAQGILFSGQRPAVFTPDTIALGQLKGICFTYRGVDEEGAGVTFTAFDGDTPVATHVLPVPANDANGNAVDATFGWINSEGVNVTRFEFASFGDGASGFVGNGQLSFDDGCDPLEATCFEQLAVVEGNVAAFLETLTGNDAYFARGSLDCINWMQNDCFWEQPSGNRLTRYGGSMFIGAAYAVCYLEWVDHPEADVLIDELVAVLECIVDHEIAYAIANGGNTCYIDRAEDYAELGNIIDEDFDNEVVATLAYRLAWLHAYYATQ